MTPETEIEILKLEKAILELDAEWYKRQDSFKIHSRYSTYFPTMENVYVQYGLMILAFISVLSFYFASLMTNKGLFCSIVILLAFTFDGYNVSKKARYYEAEKSRYENEKTELETQIKTLKQ